MGIFLILLNVLFGAVSIKSSNGFDFGLFVGILNLCVASWMVGMRTYK